MKNYYFYIIHSFKSKNVDELKYLERVETALKKGNMLLLKVLNDAKKYKEEFDEIFLLDNGQDVRNLHFTKEIKKIDENFYNIILEDDKNIISRMSDKSKKLLTEFGFDLSGWHRPFMISAKNKKDLNDKLEEKFKYLPKII